MLRRLEISGFKSFARKTIFEFSAPVTAVVGPNGSGKSNVAEALRWVLGEQSPTAIRAKRGEDFIFHGSAKAARLNQARVSIAFANKNRVLPLDYDEVIVSRTVHRDGENEYAVNGARVRLKDVIELLAAVGIGASSHHIISQGEADRFLTANPIERRAMVEDVLGIKIYQYKKEESEKKLAKTLAHMAEVGALRKEIAPHIAFLKKQADKIAAADRLREELSLFYREYFRRERTHLDAYRGRLTDEKGITDELRGIVSKLAAAPAPTRDPRISVTEAKLAAVTKSLAELSGKKDGLLREIGRLEGALAYREEAARARTEEGLLEVRVTDAKEFADATESGEAILSRGLDAETLAMALRRTVAAGRKLLETYFRNRDGREMAARVADEVAKKRRETEAALAERTASRDALIKEEVATIAAGAELRAEIELYKEERSKAELERLMLQSKKTELESELALAVSERAGYERLESDFKRELGEAGVVAGRQALDYESFGLAGDPLAEPRDEQERRLRKIERLKLRLEDAGAAENDVITEYKKSSERDEHLARELADLGASANDLRELIARLAAELDGSFAAGIEKINSEFGRFVALLFGGGRAALVPVIVNRRPRRREGDADVESGARAAAEEKPQSGIDIAIELPKKRIKTLQILSGGERALVSFALLFATSQVNPPPFLVLDETDAALDEVNSHKYGEMVGDLARRSQLIIITHNRETMARADMLYGVTMGQDGISQVLSINLSDAKK